MGDQDRLYLLYMRLYFVNAPGWIKLASLQYNPTIMAFQILLDMTSVPPTTF